MSLDSLIYLVEHIWPFLVFGFLAGLATGWFSLSGKRA
jgi:hypothetical protein